MYESFFTPLATAPLQPLSTEDLDELERAVTHSQLPATSGFFFGDNKDQLYHDQDLAFIKAARTEMFMGLKVFYNSSW
jgi:hypothetical protein